MDAKEHPKPGFPYATAKLYQVREYLKEHGYMFHPRDYECRTITFPITRKGKEGEVTCFSVKSSIIKEFDVGFPDCEEKVQILRALKTLSFPKRGGGGGGRSALSREEYIQQSTQMGISSNSSGVLQLNVAKIFGFPVDKQVDSQRTKNTGSTTIKVDQFKKTDFKFSFNKDTNTITLTLSK